MNHNYHMKQEMSQVFYFLMDGVVMLPLNIPYASSTATGLVTTETQIFTGKKTFTTSIFSDPVAILTANTTFYGLAINGKTVGAGKFLNYLKGGGQ